MVNTAVVVSVESNYHYREPRTVHGVYKENSVVAGSSRPSSKWDNPTSKTMSVKEIRVRWEGNGSKKYDGVTQDISIMQVHNPGQCCYQRQCHSHTDTCMWLLFGVPCTHWDANLCYFLIGVPVPGSGSKCHKKTTTSDPGAFRVSGGKPNFDNIDCLLRA